MWRKTFVLIGIVTLLAACSSAHAPTPTLPEAAAQAPTPTAQPPTAAPTITPTQPQPSPQPATPSPADPTATPFKVGRELIIKELAQQEITGSEITFVRQLGNGNNYERYIVSYEAEGNTIFGLLTVPIGDPPEGGYKAIVFNHGYIPPQVYETTERYNAYVNFLARAGFVVFKIDMRGHGDSEGEPTGAYFSPAYTIDAIAALKSLQTLDFVDPQGIGMWGHSMAGNITLRAMLVEPEVQAGVIWAGAVYSYDDFATYAIEDPSFDRDQQSDIIRRSQRIFDTYGRPDTSQPYWAAVSLTKNLDYLTQPLQIHHATNDPVVTVNYSRDLAAALEEAGKTYELYEYEGGGHNLVSPYFDRAMERTIAFFREHL